MVQFSILVSCAIFSIRVNIQHQRMAFFEFCFYIEPIIRRSFNDSSNSQLFFLIIISFLIPLAIIGDYYCAILISTSICFFISLFISRSSLTGFYSLTEINQWIFILLRFSLPLSFNILLLYCFLIHGHWNSYFLIPFMIILLAFDFLFSFLREFESSHVIIPPRPVDDIQPTDYVYFGEWAIEHLRSLRSMPIPSFSYYHFGLPDNNYLHPQSIPLSPTFYSPSIDTFDRHTTIAMNDQHVIELWGRYYYCDDDIRRRDIISIIELRAPIHLRNDERRDAIHAQFIINEYPSEHSTSWCIFKLNLDY